MLSVAKAGVDQGVGAMLELLRQRVQAVPDQLSVLVVAQRVDSGLGVVQVLAGAVEVAELAVAVSEVEVQ
jgi:hypothetical protein